MLAPGIRWVGCDGYGDDGADDAGAGGAVWSGLCGCGRPVVAGGRGARVGACGAGREGSGSGAVEMWDI